MSKKHVVVEALKEKYFALLRREIIGETPQITKEVDELEKAILEIMDSKELAA